MSMQDNYKIAENFLKEKNIEYYRNHPFREFSSFYIGGNIDLYIVVKKIQDFLDIANFFNTNTIDYFVMGDTSKVIVSDNGYNGIIVSLEGEFEYFEFLDDDVLVANSSSILERLSHEARIRNLSGLEFVALVNTRLGVAVYDKLESFGTSILNFIVSVKFFDKKNCCVVELNKDELTKLWKCNSKMVNELYDELHQANLSNNLTPAIFTYDGLVYKNINPSSFDDAQINYINDNFRIISGFYGVLRPFDGIIKYRLEMQSKLKINGFNNLYDYWSDSIYKEIIDESHLIINLASKEYSKSIERYLTKEDKFITIAFMEKVNDKFISKNTYSKMARGLMVNYLVKNNITTIEDIKKFNVDGYKFNEELSTNSLLVFSK